MSNRSAMCVVGLSRSRAGDQQAQCGGSVWVVPTARDRVLGLAAVSRADGARRGRPEPASSDAGRQSPAQPFGSALRGPRRRTIETAEQRLAPAAMPSRTPDSRWTSRADARAALHCASARAPARARSPDLPPSPSDRAFASRLLLVTLIGSGLLVALLVATHVWTDSQLALAQAADSFFDIFAGVVLAYAVRVAEQPRDDDHPLGHGRAEPIGALVAAVIASILALEVARSAISALWWGATPRIEPALVAVFAVKVVFKSVIYALARSRARRPAGAQPALNALAVDARNDVLVGALAIVGALAGRAGLLSLDAWLALPVAIWIGVAGIELARENLRLLMGEAPPVGRQDELTAAALEVPGVRGVSELRAQHLGVHLDIRVSILVDPRLNVQEAHDIGEEVQARLLDHDDVGHVQVHIDPDQDADPQGK